MIAFINATLIDGYNSVPRKDECVLVDGSKILSVGKYVSFPGDTEIVNLKGKTLMPGLIDTHSHLGDHPFMDGAGLQSAEKSNCYEKMRKYATAAGVTTIRSCGDYMYDTRMVADKIERGELVGPRMICSGRSFMRRDAHPATTVWAADEATVESCGAYPRSPEDARTMVKEAVDAGMDFIKIVIGDTHIMLWPETFPQLEPEIIKAIIEEAHKYGLPVACHVDHLKQANMAVDFGADELHHLLAIGAPRYEMPDYEALFRKMCQKNVWLIPTICVPRVFEQRRIDKGCPDGGIDECNNIFRRAFEFGVPIGLGCDSGCPGIPWGKSVWSEMKEYVVSLGMSPMDALRCATYNNAKMMRKETEFGSIRAGCRADMLVLDKNPAEDIVNIESINQVFRDGKLVYDADIKET